MPEPIISLFRTEITAIEARTRQILKKCGGYGACSLKYHQAPEQGYWLPALCLLSAKLAQDTNTKAVELAGVLHLFSLATYLHMALPEEIEPENLREEIQYPILVGDLLYSRVCGDICKFEMQQYLQPLATLIGEIHEELLLRDAKTKANQPYYVHDIKIYALLAECASYLGAHAAVGSNNCLVEIIRTLGRQLGTIKALRDLNCSPEGYLDCWYQLWTLFPTLPAGLGRDRLEKLILEMGRKWNLTKPGIWQEMEA